MSQLRDRHFINSSAAQTGPPDHPSTADSQTDEQHSAAAAQAPPEPGAGPTTAAEPAAATQQTRAYKPGSAVLGAVRFALRETVYVGAIVVLAVWAAQSYFGQFTPDKVSG